MSWVPSYSVSIQGSPSQERPNPLEEPFVAPVVDLSEAALEDVEAGALVAKRAKAETQSHVAEQVVEASKVIVPVEILAEVEDVTPITVSRLVLSQGRVQLLIFALSVSFRCLLWKYLASLLILLKM